MNLFGLAVLIGLALPFLFLCEVFWGRRVSLVFGVFLGGVACQIALGEAAAAGALPPLAANLCRLLVPVWMLDFLCGALTKWPRKTTRLALAGPAAALCFLGFLLRDDGERSHSALLLTLFWLDFAVFLVAGGLLGGARQRDQDADNRLEALVASRTERAAANSYAKRRPMADWLNAPARVICLVALLTVLVVPALRVFDLPVHPLAVLTLPAPAWIGLRLGLRAEAREGQRFRSYALDSKELYLFKVLVQGLLVLPFVYAFNVIGLCGLLSDILRIKSLAPPFEALAQSMLGVELAYAAGLATGTLLLHLFGNPFPPVDELLPPERPEGLNQDARAWTPGDNPKHAPDELKTTTPAPPPEPVRPAPQPLPAAPSPPDPSARRRRAEEERRLRAALSVLGLKPTPGQAPDPAAVAAAHRRLAEIYRPDRAARLGGDFRRAAEDKMRAIDAARDLLVQHGAAASADNSLTE